MVDSNAKSGSERADCVIHVVDNDARVILNEVKDLVSLTENPGETGCFASLSMTQ